MCKSHLIKNHLAKDYNDKKCNCGCGYSEAELLSIDCRLAQHWKNQDKKKDYVSMSENIYYNDGGKEKL